MKKLDNNVLRKLILETIEESSILSEGKKKKKRLKEAEPVQQPSDEAPLSNPEQDVAHGMEAEPQPEDFGINPEQFQVALEATRSGDQMKEIGGWSILGQIADKIKDAIKKKEGNKE